MDLTSIQIIKELCRQYGIHPSRKLGQNFLIPNPEYSGRENILDKIIAAAELKSSDVVLEIGPGFGTLTMEFLRRVKKVIAVEKDKRLAEFLDSRIQEYKNIKIINGDILSLLHCYIVTLLGRSKNYKVVSNLPYQITSPVLWKFLHEEKNKPEMMVLMVQKEVAERIVALPGEMSLLSVLCQFYAECELVGVVRRENFWPMPEVDSAIVKLTPKHLNTETLKHFGNGLVDQEKFFKFVKVGFSAKRKMLKNNLARGLKISQDKIVATLKKVGLDEKIRAQELRVEEWVELFLKIHLISNSPFGLAQGRL